MNMPLNIDWQQILLHLLNFMILAGGLYLLLYQPVKAFMEKRIAYFKSLEQDTAQALNHAETVKAEYEKQLSKAEEEIAEKKAAARKQTEEFCEKEIKEAQGQAGKILEDARLMADQEKEKILADARKEIVEMAAMAAEKILLEKTASSAYDQFLEAAEKEVQNV